MKKSILSLLLTLQFIGLFQTVWAAERYTQVYSSQYNSSWKGYAQGGRQLAQNQLEGQVKSTSPSALNSPEAILARLKQANNVPAEISPTLQIQHSSVLNAATDGKNLIITDTLLSKLNTNDERAFVISHELSHILLSHIAKTQIRRTGLSILDNLFLRRVGQNSILGLASELGVNLVDLKYSRNYELQADDLGVKLMTQAGYNPQAAIQVFDILKANTPPNQTPAFLLDHPITDARIRALVQKYKLTAE